VTRRVLQELPLAIPSRRRSVTAGRKPYSWPSRELAVERNRVRWAYATGRWHSAANAHRDRRPCSVENRAMLSATALWPWRPPCNHACAVGASSRGFALRVPKDLAPGREILADGASGTGLPPSSPRSGPTSGRARRRTGRMLPVGARNMQTSRCLPNSDAYCAILLSAAIARRQRTLNGCRVLMANGNHDVGLVKRGSRTLRNRGRARRWTSRPFPCSTRDASPVNRRPRATPGGDASLLRLGLAANRPPGAGRTDRRSHPDPECARPNAIIAGSAGIRSN